MESRELARLKAAGMVLIRVDRATWDELEGTRRRGARFTLNYRHSIARPAKRGQLALIAVGRSGLRIGVIRSKQAMASLDTRISFDFVDEIAASSLTRLLADTATPALRAGAERLRASTAEIAGVPDQLAHAIVDEIAADEGDVPALRRILAYLAGRGRFEDAVVMQHDALGMAVRAFGGSGEASSLAIQAPTAIAALRVMEDAVIEHDARSLPGWEMVESDITGRAVFEKHDGRLEVFTANRRPLEQLFGVDLIYLNVARGALVMVQYKMFERNRGSDDHWSARVDTQFEDELERMRRFDDDLAPHGAYRLNPGVFFLKLIRRHAPATAAGVVLSLGHFEHLHRHGGLLGRGGGLRIDPQELDGHYLGGETFVDLVRSGYVGSRGATTNHLRTLVEATLQGGRAAVAAIQMGL